VTGSDPSRDAGGAVDDEERAALIALAHCVEPADAVVGRLVLRAGPVEVVDRIRHGAVGKRLGEGLLARLADADAPSAEDRAGAVGGRIVTRLDREWPRQLDDLGAAAPFAIWVLGAADLRLTLLRSVAMVGARACTGYGELVAHTWAAALADGTWTVASGGAFGIDAAAHRGALAADGVTVCILAGGVDMPYPRAHEALLARIADEGLLVSESPLGVEVRRQRFLTRNRLIAALTRATVVVEAAERSGTMATARAAAEMARPLMAVPGPVTSPASAGCHRMIAEGEAALVTSADDLMGLLDLGGGPVPPRPRTSAERDAPPSAERDALPSAERRLLDAFPARRAVSADRLVASSGLPASAVWAGLGVLASGGWITQDQAGWRLLRDRGPTAEA